MLLQCVRSFFFFNDTATTEIYTLSLHDALPIFHLESEVLEGSGDDPAHGARVVDHQSTHFRPPSAGGRRSCGRRRDRKSTRLNSSHANISYAVFCLKKKKKNIDSLVRRNIDVYL